MFFTVPDTPLVKPELRKRKREDMQALVAEGLLRERDFLEQHCPSAQQVSTTADSEAIESTSDFEPIEGGEVAPMTPRLSSDQWELS